MKIENTKYTLKNFLPLIIIVVLVFLLAVYVSFSREREDLIENVSTTTIATIVPATTTDSTDVRTGTTPIFAKEYISAQIGDTTVTLEVVNTPKALQTGLSGRDGLAEGTGMLFVFDKSDRHGIWMKDMLFSIDVVWLDESRRVVYMVENMNPGSFPKVYRSRLPSSYVIEFPLGFVSAHNIDVNDEMTLLDF